MVIKNEACEPGASQGPHYAERIVVTLAKKTFLEAGNSSADIPKVDIDDLATLPEIFDCLEDTTFTAHL